MSKTSGADPGAAQKVADLYGTTARGRPDTRAAAEGLGVSQRTVQRWVRNGLPEKPRSDGPGRLNDKHQDWRGSPEGRLGGMSNRRESRMRNKGTSIQYTGKIKISSDERTRSTTVLLSGDQVSSILDAQLAGDDAAAWRSLESAFGDSMGGSVSLSGVQNLGTYR